ncbi:MAG TPA: YceH family protein [Pseudomonadales bacterium]
MNVRLDPIEARVIGSLMEKSLVTPDQYPLSLNALLGACNQKSSREPVMDLSEAEVAAALERLRSRYLVREKSGFGSRVTKYHYRLYNDEIGDFRFSDPQRAVVCLLLLRGPQTPGELRARSGRLHAFADTDEVERTLEALASDPEGPFVTRLAREPGRREARWAELFTADAEARTSSRGEVETPARPVAPPQQNPSPPAETLERRLAALEQRVAALEAALAAARDGRTVDS